MFSSLPPGTPSLSEAMDANAGLLGFLRATRQVDANVLHTDLFPAAKARRRGLGRRSTSTIACVKHLHSVVADPGTQTGTTNYTTARMYI